MKVGVDLILYREQSGLWRRCVQGLCRSVGSRGCSEEMDVEKGSAEFDSRTDVFSGRPMSPKIIWQDTPGQTVKPALTWQQYLRCRFCCEWRIMRIRFLSEWTPIMVYLMYFSLYFYRTLGFLRHRQIVEYIPDEWCSAIATSPNRPLAWQFGDTCAQHAHDLNNHGALQDALMQLFPNESGKMTPIFPEALQGLMIVLVSACWLYGVLCRGPNGKKPLLANCVTRCLRVLAFVAFIRPLFFLGTSLPGPAAKCVGAGEQAIRPKDWHEAFHNFGLSDENCGDLMYSGHLSSIGTLSCMFFHYGRQLLDPYIGLFQVIRVILVAMLVMQGMSIVIVRNHYTVDAVGAIIVVLLSWRMLSKEFADADPVETLEAYTEAMKEPQTEESKQRATKLKNMTEEEFAEFVQFEGSVQGGVAFTLFFLLFFSCMFMIFAAILGGHGQEH